jgi:hypothetical protein
MYILSFFQNLARSRAATLVLARARINPGKGDDLGATVISETYASGQWLLLSPLSAVYVNRLSVVLLGAFELKMTEQCRLPPTTRLEPYHACMVTRRLHPLLA